MQPVIYPLKRELLLQELTKEHFMRKTNKAGNEIYVFDAHSAPNLMREVGRIRELAFRGAGGGTGFEVDIDEADTDSKDAYKQLIVWDPDEQEILGGYRYILCKDVSLNAEGQPNLATSELFHFSDEFKNDYLPKTIELGRSFVHPDYQSSKRNAKSLYALDNLWDGLGALMIDYPEYDYFFGKVTMYTNFNQEARNMILYFMEKYFHDEKNLVVPIEGLDMNIDVKAMAEIFTGTCYNEDYKILSRNVRNLKENVPPLVSAYISISPSMKTFGTSINKGFGGVEETGILITINDIYDAKKIRHVESYQSEISNKIDLK